MKQRRRGKPGSSAMSRMVSKTRLFTKEPAIRPWPDGRNECACKKSKRELKQIPSLFSAPRVSFDRQTVAKTRRASSLGSKAKNGEMKCSTTERGKLALRRYNPVKSYRTSLELKMQHCLEQLDIPLKVVWSPKADNDLQGEIKSDCLFIYDRDEQEAWSTFEHEIYEYKFKGVSYAYRSLVNSLIENVERLLYERKERFLESLPKIIETISTERQG